VATNGAGQAECRFIDAIIHELKTSLTAIIASAELLNDELHLDEESVVGKGSFFFSLSIAE